jgi:hypothetical protein
MVGRNLLLAEDPAYRARDSLDETLTERLRAICCYCLE